MKKIVLASACILALTSAGAIAQTTGQPGAVQSQAAQPAPGASGQMKNGAMTTGSAQQDKRGDVKGSTPSGAGPNTNNNGSQAGGGAGGAGGAGSGGSGGSN
jgi:hypothetical protein